MTTISGSSLISIKGRNGREKYSREGCISQRRKAPCVLINDSYQFPIDSPWERTPLALRVRHAPAACRTVRAYPLRAFIPASFAVVLFEAIAAVAAHFCDSTSGMHPARRLFIPLQLLLHAVASPRVSPKGSSRDEIASWSLRTRWRYRCVRLGDAIVGSARRFFIRGTRPAPREPGRERERKRKRNQRSTIKAARLVCLAKAFLRPAIDPAAHIGVYVPSGSFLLLLSALLLGCSLSSAVFFSLKLYIQYFRQKWMKFKF